MYKILEIHHHTGTQVLKSRFIQILHKMLFPPRYGLRCKHVPKCQSFPVLWKISTMFKCQSASMAVLKSLGNTKSNYRVEAWYKGVGREEARVVGSGTAKKNPHLELQIWRHISWCLPFNQWNPIQWLWVGWCNNDQQFDYSFTIQKHLRTCNKSR